MEILDKILAKVKRKSTFNITVTDIKTRSCGNCEHFRRGVAGGKPETCMHYPTAQMIEVNNKVCKPNERELWSPKKHGVISRFFIWLF